MVRPLFKLQPVSRRHEVSSRGSMSDLLSRIARERDRAAFKQLFEDYGRRLQSYMMRQGADAATAEELAQETQIGRAHV